MSKGNGHNGYNGRGAMGGATPKPIRVSAHLAYLRRLIENGGTLTDDLDTAAKFCRSLIDSPDASERDRNNAAKTLATIGKMTADVALQLHKDDRADAGETDQRLEIIVRHVDRPILDANS